MRITDNCRCGANFSVESARYPQTASSEHGEWMTAHAACRERPHPYLGLTCQRCGRSGADPFTTRCSACTRASA